MYEIQLEVETFRPWACECVGERFQGQQPAPALLCHVRRQEGRKLWAWDMGSDQF